MSGPGKMALSVTNDSGNGIKRLTQKSAKESSLKSSTNKRRLYSLQMSFNRVQFNGPPAARPREKAN